jgi:hypothetical protein
MNFYLLLCFQLDFYSQLKKQNPICQVGLQAFEKLKPYYIRQLKEINTCAYKYHVEMGELRQGFNNMRINTKGIHGKGCTCSCDIYISTILGECRVDGYQFVGVIDKWNFIVCPLNDSPWHNPRCLEGNCPEYGIDMLMTYPIEENVTCSKFM